MATMISEVYDALRDAQGVSDEKARKAAEAVAAFQDRFHQIEQKLDAGFAGVDRRLAGFEQVVNQRFAGFEQAADRRFAAAEVRFAKIEGEMTLLKWMTGGLYALLVPGLFVLLRVASKTGAFG